MNTTLTENEAIFRFSKIFLAQYLSTMRTSPHMQITLSPSMIRPSTSLPSSSSKVYQHPLSHQTTRSQGEVNYAVAGKDIAEPSPSIGGG